MNGEVPVLEAAEWREPAPGGGSQAQVFRLVNNQFVLVKFPENDQGELVLANEFLCCRLAEHLELPINRAVHVSVDERLLRGPRQDGKIKNDFSAGIRCGMIRFEKSQTVTEADILKNCSNSAELHHIVIFDTLVYRQDARQLLMYTPPGQNAPRFGAIDYGFAFGGNPNWTAAELAAAPQPVLPANDPFTGQEYAQDGAPLAVFVERLRVLTPQQVQDILMQLYPTRWGVNENDVQALVSFLDTRGRSLVQQFDERHSPPQLQVL